MIRLLTIVDFLLSLICYGSFTWAVAALFRRDGPLTFAMQSLAATDTMFSLIQWWAIFDSRSSAMGRTVGALLFLSALALFWWSVPYARRSGLGLAFAADRGADFIFVGPYRWIRHPFYASYMLYWIAGSVAAGEPLLLLSLAIILFPAVE
jgi:protein-S-isoprenylcysteine O-methyltransferase Ste14